MRVLDRREAVRYEQHCAARPHGGEGGLDRSLGADVQAGDGEGRGGRSESSSEHPAAGPSAVVRAPRRGLIQHQDGGVP